MSDSDTPEATTEELLLEGMRPILEEFDDALDQGHSPDIEGYVARCDRANAEQLRQRLILAEFQHKFLQNDLTFTSQYQPMAILGSGSFGVVYKAFEIGLDRFVAIKVLTDLSERSKRRFEQEVKRQAKFPEKHPHLVSIHAGGLLPSGNPYAVMQYVEGGTLHDLIESSSEIKVEEAVRIAMQISDGLAAMSDKSTHAVIHQDLKPKNILLDQAGNALVADFGLAASVTDLHVGVAGRGGTKPYMSPEQAEAMLGNPSPPAIDTRSDIWAIGVILFELLTGVQPFHNSDGDALLSMIIEGETPKLSDMRSGIPFEIHEIIHECLQVDAGKRIQSVKELRTRLKRFLDSVSEKPLPLDFNRQILSARQRFSDRPWLFDEISAWPNHASEQLLLIIGEFGSGKTALLGELVGRDTGGNILAWHFCSHDNRDSRAPGMFVHSFIGMLHERLQSYRQFFSDVNVRQTAKRESCESDPAGVLKSAVLDLLAKCDPPDPDITYFMVVDALDEADQKPECGIPELVSQLASGLPCWMRVIASVRRDALDTNQFVARTREVIVDREHASCRIEIVEDIRRCLLNRLDEPNFQERITEARTTKEALTAAVLDASEINFLYVSMLLDAIEDGKIAISDIGELPPGLHALYGTFFRRQWPNEASFASVRSILELLLAAQEPLADHLIGEALNLDEYQLGSEIEALSQYLLRHDGFSQLRHHSLRNWLKGAGGPHRTSENRGHVTLVKYCEQAFLDDDYEGYTQHNHVAHVCLLAAPRNCARGLLSNETWLRNRFLLDCYSNQGIFQFRRDLNALACCLKPRDVERKQAQQLSKLLLNWEQKILDEPELRSQWWVELASSTGLCPPFNIAIPDSSALRLIAPLGGYREVWPGEVELNSSGCGLMVENKEQVLLIANGRRVLLFYKLEDNTIEPDASWELPAADQVYEAQPFNNDTIAIFGRFEGLGKAIREFDTVGKTFLPFAFADPRLETFDVFPSNNGFLAAIVSDRSDPDLIELPDRINPDAQQPAVPIFDLIIVDGAQDEVSRVRIPQRKERYHPEFKLFWYSESMLAISCGSFGGRHDELHLFRWDADSQTITCIDLLVDIPLLDGMCKMPEGRLAITYRDEAAQTAWVVVFNMSGLETLNCKFAEKFAGNENPRRRRHFTGTARLSSIQPVGWCAGQGIVLSDFSSVLLPDFSNKSVAKNNLLTGDQKALESIQDDFFRHAFNTFEGKLCVTGERSIVILGATREDSSFVETRSEGRPTMEILGIRSDGSAVVRYRFDCDDAPQGVTWGDYRIADGPGEYKYYRRGISVCVAASGAVAHWSPSRNIIHLAYSEIHKYKFETSAVATNNLIRVDSVHRVHGNMISVVLAGPDSQRVQFWKCDKTSASLVRESAPSLAENQFVEAVTDDLIQFDSECPNSGIPIGDKRFLDSVSLKRVRAFNTDGEVMFRTCIDAVGQGTLLLSRFVDERFRQFARHETWIYRRGTDSCPTLIDRLILSDRTRVRLLDAHYIEVVTVVGSEGGDGSILRVATLNTRAARLQKLSDIPLGNDVAVFDSSDGNVVIARSTGRVEIRSTNDPAFCHAVGYVAGTPVDVSIRNQRVVVATDRLEFFDVAFD